MELHNIKDVSDNILTALDSLLTKHCQPGKFSLIEIRDTYTKNTDILYIFDGTVPVYFLLLDLFPKHKAVYIHDVCVNTAYRGQGQFKKSLAFLKPHYAKLGYTHFTLDASDSTKEAGLNQKARIQIFHKAGFNINPETGYYTPTGDYELIKTLVELSDGSRAEIQNITGTQYVVKNAQNVSKTVSIQEIEKCFDSHTNQLSCPMIMPLTHVAGTRNKIIATQNRNMPRRATRKVQRRNKRSKTRRGGGLKAAALGAAALASGMRPGPGPTPVPALGMGQTHMVGPGPYALGVPYPSRNTPYLNVYPTPTPTPGPGSLWTMKNGTQLVMPKQHAMERVWPTPLPGAVKGMWNGAFDPPAGSRYISPPEVQTWNPYLRGDPHEVVDYYEGYSAKDKAAREAEDAAVGIVREPVERQDTPMWKAALSWSAQLPSTQWSSYNPIEWEMYARQGRALGMNVPLNDPRTGPASDPKWAGVPQQIAKNVLQSQLYHAQLGPMPGSLRNGRGKGGINLEKHWNKSEKTMPWNANRQLSPNEARALLSSTRNW
jgi:hypothetical protein